MFDIAELENFTLMWSGSISGISEPLLMSRDRLQWNLDTGKPLGPRQIEVSPEWTLGRGVLIINQQIKFLY